MSQNSVDDLLSDFFKSKMRSPWPAAPTTQSAEPSSLRAARRASHGNRARVTLAASVAILLGTCWYLSNGSQPAERGSAKPAVPGILDDGSAKMPPEFKKDKKANVPTGPMLN